LAFQRLPSLHQSQPERPVFGIARCASKAAAFGGATLEFIVATGSDNSERKVFGSGLLVEHGAGSVRMTIRRFDSAIGNAGR
jgi:hypothetical protein